MKWFLMAALLSFLLLGCAAQPTATPSPVKYSQYQLEYRLLGEFPNVFWNDPDFYPIAREGQELQNALQQFVSIRSNNVEFSAILEHLGLDRKDNYTDEEKLLIYRQHKLLTLAVQMTPLSSADFSFVLRVGEGQGERIEGKITAEGKITVEKREPSFNTHPICLTKGTLIATPAGDIAVQEVEVGTIVWTMDMSGARIAAPVIETSFTPVSGSYRALAITLDDGRMIQASPGHPSAEGKPLSEYRLGDSLDGSKVIKTELVSYQGGQTYDLLPSTGAGLYWGNNILLKSTLVAR